MDQHSAALDRAHRHALDWLSSLEDRPVPPQATIDQVTQALGTALPNDGSDPTEVVDLLAEACDPGLTAMGSGRFFGFVIGGTHPAALAADWLVSAWDQNCGLRRVTPAHSAVEDVTSAWLLDLLGLPGES
ncbi:MAG: aspartate aminotransferase family protein, partial [Dermatophilaceae bacterium]